MPSCVQILKERDVGGVARLLLRQLHVWGIASRNCGKLESGGDNFRGFYRNSLGATVKTLYRFSLCGRVHSRRVPGYSRSQRRSRIC